MIVRVMIVAAMTVAAMIFEVMRLSPIVYGDRPPCTATLVRKYIQNNQFN